MNERIEMMNFTVWTYLFIVKNAQEEVIEEGLLMSALNMTLGISQIQ